MKIKKLMALALSAVLAASMLAGCGGGGSSGGGSSVLSTSTVNSELRAVECDARVKSSSDLNDALSEAALYMESGGLTSSDALAGFLARARSYGKTSGLWGASFVLTEEELEDGMDPTEAVNAIASQVKVSADTEKLVELGDLDSTAKIAAAVVLGVSEGLQELADSPLLNVSDVVYYAGARKLTLKNDVTYYLIAVEMDMNAD